MATQPTPEIVLYDLACTKNICFSPTVWRIRLILNYKRIPYTTTFLEFQDIEPTLSQLPLPPHAQGSNGKYKYTVPAIHHLPTNTYLMDSAPIAHFLETTYPSSPALAPSTDQTAQIEAQLLAVARSVLYGSLVPREINVLAPPAQAYFRRTREADLEVGKKLEDLLEGEEEAWEGAREGLRALDGLITEVVKAGGGRFVGGQRPGWTDFFVAGVLRCARTVDEGVFERLGGLEGVMGVYEACLEWMERDA